MEASSPSVPADNNFAFAATYSKSTAQNKNKGPGAFSQTHLPIPTTRPPSHVGPSSNRPDAPHSGDNKPICQICSKKGHMALDCYNWFNFSYQGRLPPSDLAVMAAEGNTSYAQHVWYADGGANAHITNNTANLTTAQPYEGEETITVGNGSSLVIQNMGEQHRATTTPRAS
ncbi:hypothetical protein I3760_05G167500 [Carya illinoinensis]|nr:hypothetical protein I3760_05G167500 [Carya illinoinensis]